MIVKIRTKQGEKPNIPKEYEKEHKRLYDEFCKAGMSCGDAFDKAVEIIKSKIKTERGEIAMNEITAKEKETIINDTVKILDALNDSSRYSKVCTDTRATTHEIYPRIEKGMLECMKALNLPSPPALTKEAVLNALEPCGT